MGHACLGKISLNRLHILFLRLVSPFTADAILSYNYYAIAQMIPRDLFPRQ